MPFCHNCGAKVENKDLYCHKCGASLADNNKGGDAQSEVWGYLFTNTGVLSSLLGTTQQEVVSVLNRYIDCRAQQGIHYILIDAANYQFHSKGASRWMGMDLESRNHSNYEYLIVDSYNYDVFECGRKVEYVFIVGGDNVVPMHKVNNPLCSKDENDEHIVEKIDTDLLYGALYGHLTEDMLEDMTLVQKPHMLFVGRLPIGEDSNIDTLSRTLNRFVAVGQNGLTIESFYGQVDPHWKNTSVEVAERLLNKCVYREVQNYHYQNLTLTPYVLSAKAYESCRDQYDLASPLHKHFNYDANLYYFNMHGSDALELSGFYGQDVDSNMMFEGITPTDIGMINKTNIIVTEACFGARFIGKKSSESMMLSAFANKTILYLGSSRIAYGCSSGMTCADVITHIFMKELCQGHTAGAAMHLARKAVIDNDGISSPSTHLTIAEFNLFGDPSQRIYPPGVNTPLVSVSPKDVLFTCDKPKSVLRKAIYKGFSSQRLLSLVEGMVNRSISQNHEMIKTHLYDYYKITLPPLTFATKNYYGKSCESYTYFYNNNDSSIVVELSPNNTIRKILTSK